MKLGFLLTLGFLICVVLAPCHAGVILTFDNASVFGYPGSSIDITGSIQNTGSMSIGFLSLDFYAPPPPGVNFVLPQSLLSLTIGAGSIYSGSLFTAVISPTALPSGPTSVPVSVKFAEGVGAGSVVSNIASTNLTVQAIPEPGTVMVTLIGLVLLGWGGRRISRRVKPPSGGTQDSE